MFVLEVTAGRRADSSALLADSADFLADAFNYGISLWALTQAATARAEIAVVETDVKEKTDDFLERGVLVAQVGLFTGWSRAWGATPKGAVSSLECNTLS
jgi:hypothetical protein